MKKLFFLTTLVLFFANFSFAQTINVSTGVNPSGLPVTQTTPDPLWQVTAGPSITTPQQAVVVPTYPFNWQATPIATTNAQWINYQAPHFGLAGNFVYERPFTVASATASLNCNFGIAFDDTLISLELVPPTGSPIPLTATTSNNYSISNMITTSISNPIAGIWRIKAEINYFDAVGGLLLSGTVEMKKADNCSCGNWNGIQYQLIKSPKFSSDEKPKMLPCGKTLVVKSGFNVVFNPSFSCIGTCKTTYKAVLSSENGTKEEILKFPYVFTKTASGSYNLSIVPFCGDTKCKPCTVKIFITPGCHGDVLEPVLQQANQIENTLFNGGRG